MYIIAWLSFAVWYFPRLVKPIAHCVGKQDCNTTDSQDALNALRVFPLHFWAIFLFYLTLAPASVILSAEYFTDYVAQPVDWFRIQLIALIVSIIVGLPIFFLVYDLFGRALSGIAIKRPYVSLKSKVFMIGALVPLLIDTMLVQYFWTRTGYFEVETFVVWLSLEILAIIGSLIFVRSISQSLSPLQELILHAENALALDVNKLQSLSTDEMGVLSADYTQLLQDLQKGEQRYRQLIESTESIPWELDLETWLFTYVGPQAVEILGYPVEDWYQEAFWQNHIFAYDREEAINYCVASTDRGEDHEFEYRMIAADGHKVWIRDYVNVIHENGRPVRLHGFMFDISSQKQAREALRQSEDRFKQIFHASPEAVLISYMNDGRVIDVNQSFENLFGYRLQDIKGKTTVDFGFWKDAEDRPLFLEQIKRTGDLEEAESILITRSGEQLRCQFSAHPIGLDGEECLITVLRDVTERRRIEYIIQMLAQSPSTGDYESFLGSMVQNLTIAYGVQFAFIGQLLADKRQVQVRAVWAGNELAENFIYDLQGTPCQDVLNLEMELIAKDAWRLYPDDVMLKDMGVESYYGVPLIASDDRLLGLIVVMDVKSMEMQPWIKSVLAMFGARVAAEMERQDDQEELEVHRHHLEDLVNIRTAEIQALNHELESFSYSVSHDLRAPLRSISGFSQALMEDYAGKLDEEGQNYLERVRNGAIKMSTLIDDLLELSRVSRREMKRQRVDITAIAYDVIKELQEHEPERVVAITIQKGLELSGDPKLLGVVMINLIGNAWKYTSKRDGAHIEIGMHTEDSIPVFFVRDNGIGFDMQYAKKLFGAFQRLHNVAEYEGTGIGLATVQRVINRHGGRVWAQSIPDKGAAFYFTITDHINIKS